MRTHDNFPVTCRKTRYGNSLQILILKLSALVLLPPFSTATITQAQVYKSQSGDGKLIYSSKAPAKGARPAQLPPIMRGEVKVPTSALESCNKHGGINCQSGADIDGSVICYDGFRDAAARFRFSCNAPKLEITSISDPDKDGGFTVFVRNSRSVQALKTALACKMPDGNVLKLSGPSQVDPNGVAEFRHEGGLPQKLLLRPGPGDIQISCENCP